MTVLYQGINKLSNLLLDWNPGQITNSGRKNAGRPMGDFSHPEFDTQLSGTQRHSPGSMQAPNMMATAKPYRVVPTPRLSPFSQRTHFLVSCVRRLGSILPAK